MAWDKGVQELGKITTVLNYFHIFQHAVAIGLQYLTRYFCNYFQPFTARETNKFNRGNFPETFS